MGLPRRQRGQSLLELAFIAIILMLLAFGVFEFGRGFLTYTTITNAARDGARLGMDPSKTTTDITSAVTAAAAPYPVTVVVDWYPANAATRRVTVSYPFQSPIPLVNALWGGGPLTVQHQMSAPVPGPTPTPGP